MDHIHTLAVVDDDEIVRYLTKIIVDQSHSVDQIKMFCNGKEAVDYIRCNANNPNQLPDVILLDLEMPVMDGWTFLEEFIEVKPAFGKKIIIFVISSISTQNILDKIKSLHEVSDFIIKPISPEKFRHVVEIFKTSRKFSSPDKHI